MPALDASAAGESPIHVSGYTVTRAEWAEAELICTRGGYLEAWAIELIAIGIHLINRDKANPIKE